MAYLDAALHFFAVFSLSAIGISHPCGIRINLRLLFGLLFLLVLPTTARCHLSVLRASSVQQSRSRRGNRGEKNGLAGKRYRSGAREPREKNGSGEQIDPDEIHTHS